MIKFPEGLFADVRVEETASTALAFANGEWQTNRIRREKGAFLRVYDGTMWYYAATTDLDRLQEELDERTRGGAWLDRGIIRKVRPGAFRIWLPPWR